MSGVDPATSAPLCPAAAVIGSGAWGTIFASLLVQTDILTTIQVRRREMAEEINSDTNERYVPGHRPLQGLKVTTDLAQAVTGASIVVVVVFSQEARRVLEPPRGALADDAVAVSFMRGIELGTGLRMSEVLAEALGIDSSRVVVASGPNFVDKVVAGRLTATVVAAGDEQVAVRIASLCAIGTFCPYTNTDVPGVELCGAVKNIIALAVGVAAGRGLRDNSKTTVTTRGLVEITRLGLKLGACPETFSGLAGMGNLVATCSSPLNRNQTLGRHLGEGMSVAEAAAASRGVTGGAKSARVVPDLARAHGMDMPITIGVITVVGGATSVVQVTGALLVRSRKSEGMYAVPSQAQSPRGVEACFTPGSSCIISMSDATRQHGTYDSPPGNRPLRVQL